MKRGELLASFNPVTTMTSRKIAGLTGKAHPKVTADILNLCAALEIDVAGFRRIYKDAAGRTQTEYLLPKRETLMLVAGYSINLCTAAEQRQLWREVGEGLNYGRAQEPADRNFKGWCDEHGFGDIASKNRADAIWFAGLVTRGVTSLPDSIAHPTHCWRRPKIDPPGMRTKTWTT